MKSALWIFGPKEAAAGKEDLIFTARRKFVHLFRKQTDLFAMAIQISLFSPASAGCAQNTKFITAASVTTCNKLIRKRNSYSNKLLK
jgi:hypothetical protein